jgi:hypothetical protein
VVATVDCNIEIINGRNGSRSVASGNSGAARAITDSAISKDCSSKLRRTLWTIKLDKHSKAAQRVGATWRNCFESCLTWATRSSVALHSSFVEKKLVSIEDAASIESQSSSIIWSTIA